MSEIENYLRLLCTTNCCCIFPKDFSKITEEQAAIPFLICFKRINDYFLPAMELICDTIVDTKNRLILKNQRIKPEDIPNKVCQIEFIRRLSLLIDSIIVDIKESIRLIRTNYDFSFIFDMDNMPLFGNLSIEECEKLETNDKFNELLKLYCLECKNKKIILSDTPHRDCQRIISIYENYLVQTFLPDINGKKQIDLDSFQKFIDSIWKTELSLPVFDHPKSRESCESDPNIGTIYNMVNEIYDMFQEFDDLYKNYIKILNQCCICKR